MSENLDDLFPKGAAKSNDLDALIDQAPQPTNQASTEAQLKAGGEAGLKAGVEGVFSTIGAGTGAAIGSLGGPIGTVGGMIGGGLVGQYAGQSLTGFFGLRGAEQMPADVRPAAVFSENVSSAISSAGTVMGTARTGLRLTSNWFGGKLNEILETAKRLPKTFLTVEATGGIAAGIGGAAVTAADPNVNPWVRAGAEITAGFLNPVSQAANTYSFVTGVISKARGSLGRTAQENKLASFVLNGLKDAGEDPRDVIAALRAADPQGFEKLRTAGMKTGSRFLAGVERGLAEHSGDFGNESREKFAALQDLVRIQMGALAQSGDPKALELIAQARKTQFDGIMIQWIQQSETKLAMSLAKLKGGATSADKATLSVNATNAMRQVLDEAEGIEKQMWSQVQRNVPVPMTNLLRVRDEILGESAKYLKGEKIPGYMEAAIGDATKRQTDQFDFDPTTFVIKDRASNPASLNSVELIDYRSKLLTEARQATIAGDYDKARYLHKLQGAILDDLEAVYRNSGDTAYDIARDFTKSKYDAFERSFAGKTLTTSKHGERIPPDLMLQQAFSQGADAANLKLKDLERATRFLVDRGYGDMGATETMLDAQEQMYRVIVSSAIDKAQGGKINPDTVRALIDKNAVLFNRAPFNEVKTDLLNALKSKEGLARMENFAKNMTDVVGRDSPWAKVLKSDPVKMAGQIIVSPGDREAQLSGLIAMAKQGASGISPDEGLNAVRASVFTAAADRAKHGGDLNLDILKSLVVDSATSGSKPIIDVLVEQGAMTKAHAKNVRELFDMFTTAQRARSMGNAVTVPPGKGEMGLVIAGKIAMSKLVSGMQKVTGASGSELIIHGAAARGVEHILSKVPAAKTKDLAVQLMNDPVALAKILERPMNAAAVSKQVRFLNAWLVQSGLTAVTRPTYEEPQPDVNTMFTR